MKAVVLCAGLGTRLKPLTEEWPKCLMPIGKRPLLEYWFDIFHTLKISSVLTISFESNNSTEAEGIS